MRSAETPATPAGSATWDRIRAALDPLFIAAAWLYARPRVVLAGLVATQWVAILAFALTVRHNGWVYYQGGDQIWYTTSAWLLGDGVLPPTYIGFGWVLPLVPLSWLVGPDYVGFLPAVIGFNVLVLGPIALACVYAIAAPDRRQAAGPLRRGALGRRAATSRSCTSGTTTTTGTSSSSCPRRSG